MSVDYDDLESGPGLLHCLAVSLRYPVTHLEPRMRLSKRIRTRLPARWIALVIAPALLLIAALIYLRFTSKAEGWVPSEEPFDPEIALYEGRPVAEVINRTQSADAHDRNGAVLDLRSIAAGLDWRCVNTMKTAPDREWRMEMLHLAESDRIGSRVRLIVPLLIRALQDPSAEVRACAGFVLMDIGPLALQAVDALTRSLKDPDPHARLWAARALYFVNFESLATGECSADMALHGPDESSRGMGAYNLKLMGVDAAHGLRRLRDAARDPDEAIRTRATSALEFIAR